MLKKMLLLCAIALYTSNLLAALPFNPDRCGVEYPKMPETNNRAPSQPFHSVRIGGVQFMYYPLVCKTGPGMQLKTTFDLTHPNSQAIVGQVEVRFRKAARAATDTGAGLNPGECGWVDRPMNVSEPSKLAEMYNAESMGIEITSLIGSNGLPTTQIGNAPSSYDYILASNRLVFFYVRVASGNSFASAPFCQKLGNNIVGKPFSTLR